MFWILTVWVPGDEWVFAIGFKAGTKQNQGDSAHYCVRYLLPERQLVDDGIGDDNLASDE